MFSKEFDCPSIPVLGVCSNQGTCDDTTGTCTCDEGFQGIQCLGKYIVLKSLTSEETPLRIQFFKRLAILPDYKVDVLLSFSALLHNAKIGHSK